MPTSRSSQIWSYIGLILGGGVSISANMAHAYIHPAQPPALGAVAMSIVWPILVLVAVELMARTVWPEGLQWMLIRVVGLGLVALVAAAVSYHHLSGLLQHYKEDDIVVALGPLAIDGLMMMATASMLVGRQRPSAVDAGEAPPDSHAAKNPACGAGAPDPDTHADTQSTEIAADNARQDTPDGAPAAPEGTEGTPRTGAPVPVAAPTAADPEPISQHAHAQVLPEIPATVDAALASTPQESSSGSPTPPPPQALDGPAPTSRPDIDATSDPRKEGHSLPPQAHRQARVPLKDETMTAAPKRTPKVTPVGETRGLRLLTPAADEPPTAPVADTDRLAATITIIREAGRTLTGPEMAQALTRAGHPVTERTALRWRGQAMKVVQTQLAEAAR